MPNLTPEQMAEALKDARFTDAGCYITLEDPHRRKRLAKAFLALHADNQRLREALELSKTALSFSTPIMAHYEEPRLRHSEALKAARQALNTQEGKDDAK